MIDLTRGPARERVPADQVATLQQAGTLVVDDRRTRPYYFDGRFLAARELTRDQDYVLVREADLGRAGGAGAVDGLLVTAGPTATTIQIAAGHGITGAGELVLLQDAITLDLADVPEIQLLDSAFGLASVPRTPARNLSGLFVVGLRPVEFAANPITAYPTTINGRRSQQDGDIVEGVAITLIPYPDDGTTDPATRRARVARQVFVQGGARAIPPAVLPLAMIALDRAAVQWVDAFLARRELGAAQADTLGLGIASRAEREAYLLQYDQQLQDVLAQRQAANLGWRFAATDHFQALPPAGRLPAAAIDPAAFTQTFFPPPVAVDLSIVPDDEVPALLEESLSLPPIDLTSTGDDLDSTSILVVVPVPRARLRQLAATLPTGTANGSSSTGLTTPLRPAAPGLVAQRKPLEVLLSLRLPPLPPRPQNPGDAAWASVVNGAASQSGGLLWYVRRRNLAYRSDVVGGSTNASTDELKVESDLLARLKANGQDAAYLSLRNRASAPAAVELVALFASAALADKVLAAAALADLTRIAKLDRAAVLAVAQNYDEPDLGEGLARVEAKQPDLRDKPASLAALVASGAVLDLDRVTRTMSEVDLTLFAGQIAAAAAANKPAAIRDLVNQKLQDGQP